MKPILCLDFDGVCHSYTSGWKGATIIPDPPVDGMWEFLAEAFKEFQICIFSSRSNFPRGEEAMFEWFKQYARDPDEFLIAARLEFPTEKPAALITIDDRAYCFNGIWPDVKELRAFQPWNKEQEIKST